MHVSPSPCLVPPHRTVILIDVVALGRLGSGCGKHNRGPDHDSQVRTACTFTGYSISIRELGMGRRRTTGKRRVHRVLGNSSEGGG